LRDKSMNSVASTHDAVISGLSTAKCPQE
jgi:hypothetical protein